MTSNAVVLVPTPAPIPAIPVLPTPRQAALASLPTPLAPSTNDDVGILQPPDEMRVIIDKTALWVARNGSSFEQKVKEKQKENNQFSFLRPGNSYYAYYQQKVREIRRIEVIAEVGDKESVENAVEIKMHVKRALLGELPLEGEVGADGKKTKKRAEGAAGAPGAQGGSGGGGGTRKENLEPPPKEEWVLEKPNISALQDDIIKLSAQFVARNGRVFQSGLLEREHKNAQFGFLQTYHPLHQYFKKLVQDYTKCLLPEKTTTEKLIGMARDKQGIVNRVMKKVQWEKAQKKTEEEKRREEEAERNAMALIDWHDFAVVQVIEWEDEDEEEEEDEESPSPAPSTTPTPAPALTPTVLPLPTLPTLPSTPPITLPMPHTVQPHPQLQPHSQPPLPIPMVTPASAAAAKSEAPLPLSATSPHEKTVKGPSIIPPPPEDEDEHEDVDMDMDDDDFEPEPQRNNLPIRLEFNPRLKTATTNDLRYVTPSGQQISPAEAEMTIRIELSNTKVIEKKKQDALNERDSNLAEGDEISKHLKNFAARRTDIFGDELGLGPEDTKKPNIVEKPTWDGHSSSIQRVAMEALGGMSVHQQIKAIHESKGLTAGESSEPTIGPKLSATVRTTATAPPRPPEPTRMQPPPPRPNPVMSSVYAAPPGMHPYATGGPPPHIRPGPFPIPMAAPPHFAPPRMTQMMPGPVVVPAATAPPPPPVSGGLKLPEDETPAKLQKMKDKKDEITKKLIGEKEFLEAHPGPVNIVIKVPNQPVAITPGGTSATSAKWPAHLNGQTYRVQVLITDTIKTLKQKLSELLEMPPNKQKLRAEGLGFLKDAKSLAFYNATDNIEVELGIKERGGRKKV